MEKRNRQRNRDGKMDQKGVFTSSSGTENWITSFLWGNRRPHGSPYVFVFKETIRSHEREPKIKMIKGRLFGKGKCLVN